jgi:beta-ureidopropionase
MIIVSNKELLMNTFARIATVCQGKRYFPTLEENRTHVMKLLGLALRQKPDLVCLPEAFSSVSVSCQHISEVAESLPGPTTDAAAQRARQGRCYVVCPVVTQREGAFWNSAVVIDRDGSILGVYDKLHPVTTSSNYTVFESGTSPGKAPNIFDLDFGRVGIQICFDIQFAESWAALAGLGARLVFWPSAYNGGFPLQAYAWRHHFYVVSAVQTEKARLIDPLGVLLAETDFQKNVIWRDINLDYAVCHYDFNYSIPDRLMANYPESVSVRTNWDAGHFIIEPVKKEVTIAQLRREIGFITVEEYAQLHRNAFERYHAGQPPVPQKAAHGDRPMYAKNKETSNEQS